MLDKIETQLKRKDVLAKMNSYAYGRNADAVAIAQDLYPFNLDYYHELNPAFLVNVSNIEFFDLFPVVTVRDGAVVFASWMLRNMHVMSQVRTHFYIGEKHARMLPPNLMSSFSCWKVVQKNKITPQAARRILLTGILNDITLDLKDVEVRLQSMGKIPQDMVLDIFIPQRRNPFSLPWMESNIIQELVELIKTYFPANKLNFLKVKDILDSTNWAGTYVEDLFQDSIYVHDSYVNHFIAARGGTISSFSSNEANNSYYELDLSFHHKVQYYPLPKTDSIFADLIFHKKQSGGKDLLADLSFHALLKK